MFIRKTTEVILSQVLVCDSPYGLDKVNHCGFPVDEFGYSSDIGNDTYSAVFIN